MVYSSSNSSSGFTAIDTIADTSFIDSTSRETGYYKIAALNSKGIGNISTYDAGSILMPPDLSISCQKAFIRLNISSNSSSNRHIIYRSSDSASFSVIDTTLAASSVSYIDSVPDFNTYYYRVSTLSTNNESKLSGIKSGFRIISAPENFTVIDCEKGVLLTWNRVPEHSGT